MNTKHTCTNPRLTDNANLLNYFLNLWFMTPYIMGFIAQDE